MTLYALIGCLISMINAEYMIHSSNRFLIKLNITGGVIIGVFFTLNSCLVVYFATKIPQKERINSLFSAREFPYLKLELYC